MQLAPQTVHKLHKAAGFGFHDGFHHLLPAAIQDRDHHRFLVHVHADILEVATHCSCLLIRGFRGTTAHDVRGAGVSQ